MSQPSTSRTWKPLEGDSIGLPTTQVLEQGKDHIVSFEGASQFTAQGVSACGIAAFNFARVAFRIEQGGQNLPDVLNELSTKEVIEEIVAICAGWSSNMHLEVEDIHNLPIFNRCLHLETIEYGRPRPRHFQKILGKMTQIDNSTVMIITRPPEIIACIKFANHDLKKDADTSMRSSTTLDKPVFVIFDSHPRPSHPHGAGLSFSTSVENTAHTLSDILPIIDESMFDSNDFQWQAQLLANCSAHVYVAQSLREEHEAAIVQSSLAILELRAQISEFQRENQIIGSDNRQLESEVGRLRASVREEQKKTQLPVEGTFAWAAAAIGNRVPVLGHSLGYISHAIAGSSGSSGTSTQKSVVHHRPTDMSSTASASAKRTPQAPVRPRAFSNTTGAQSIFADNPPPVPSKALPTYDDLVDSGSDDSEDFKDFDDPQEDESEEVARQLQNEFDSEDRQLRRELQRLVKEVQWKNVARHQQNVLDSEDRWIHQEQKKSAEEHQAANVAREQQNGLDSEDGWIHQEQKKKFPKEHEATNVARQQQNSEDRRFRQEQKKPARELQAADVARQLQSKLDFEDRWLRREQYKLAQEHQTANVARQLQHQFDSEDQCLRLEHEGLAQLAQATFQCNICLDELPEDDVAKVDECSHTTCRSCLREFVSAKIQEHRYPIFCPMCTAVVDEPRERPGVISRLLIEQLGVTEEQSQILTEMELAEFTVQIHCRRCKRPAFVDREDYTDVVNIVCPQSDCHHVWCKKCEQAIIIDGPQHSCDGSSELDHLMKEKGWKHCPNCTTPIQKESGCNHMTCITSGCNTHFCYLCGDKIARSALGSDIKQAVSTHFARLCQLFEVPD